MSSLHFFYRCIGCGKNWPPDRPYYTCPDCGKLLLVERDLDYLRSYFSRKIAGCQLGLKDNFFVTFNSKKTNSGVWNWADLVLPGFLDNQVSVSLGEGNTPLWVTPEWLAKKIGLNRLFIKNEGYAPSGSFKDRGMPVAIADALRLQKQNPELGIKYVVCASTGDTSASAALYCAYVRDRLSCIVLVPAEKISPAQMYQVMDAGATVLAIEAEDGFDGCMRIVQQFTQGRDDMVLVNSKNAMRIVGQETISLEIAKNLAYGVPDFLVIPVGNAGNVAAQMSAWKLLKDLGIIDRLPKLILAQTKTANTVVRWINSGFTDYSPGQPGLTQASAMNIQNPVSKPRIDYLRNGFEIYGFDVEEDEIAQTRAMFNRAGAGLCTQGGVILAATLKARNAGIIKEDDCVVAINTANDLKFTEPGVAYHLSGNEFSNQPKNIPANLEAVNEAVKDLS